MNLFRKDQLTAISFLLRQHHQMVAFLLVVPMIVSGEPIIWQQDTVQKTLVKFVELHKLKLYQEKETY